MRNCCIYAQKLPEEVPEEVLCLGCACTPSFCTVDHVSGDVQINDSSGDIAAEIGAVLCI